MAVDNQTVKEPSTLVEQILFDEGIEQFFNELFRQAKTGKIPHSTIEEFIPDEVKARCST